MQGQRDRADRSRGMRRGRRLWLALPLLLLAACAPLTPEPGAQIESARDAEITVEGRGQTLLLDIHSETGIGSAQVALEEPLPRDLVLRLHLRGLEELTFAYEAATVRVAVASTGEPLVRQELLPAGEGTTTIERGSPYWMDVGILGGESEAAIPLGEGSFFDVRVPQEFLRGGYRSFTLSWIDFYR